METYRYTDAIDIINIKRDVLKKSINALQEQIECCKLDMQIQYHTIKIAEQKIELINKVDAIYAEQVPTFSTDRQDLCAEYATAINDLDTPSPSLKILIEKRDTKYQNLHTIINTITDIEKKIPETCVVTNFSAVYDLHEK